MVLNHAKTYDIGRMTISSRVDNIFKREEQANSKRCEWGQRHVVATMGFIILALLSGHFTAFGVSIVAMVNHTKSYELQWQNETESSCPMLISIENTTNNVIDGEFNWDSAMQGNIIGASVFGYVLTQLIGGRLAEKYGSKRTVLIGNFLTGLLALISPILARWNVYALIVIQFLKGLTLGVLMASIFVLNANWFPSSERTLLSSLVNCGYSFGSAASGAISGWLCDIPSMGWTSTFYLIGGATIADTVLCAYFVYETPKHHPRITAEECKFITGDQELDLTQERPPFPWKKVVRSIPVYALMFGTFGYFWSLAYFVNMHPTYMGTILHFSMSQNGVISSLPHLIRTLGGFLTSVICNVLKNRFSVNYLRKGCNTIGAIGYCLAVLGIILAGCNTTVNVTCFVLALFFSGIYISGSLIVAVDMSPRYPGTLMGFATTIPSIGAAMLPVVVGVLTTNETITEWNEVFYICIAIVFISAIVFNFFGSAEVQPWNFSDEELRQRKENAANDDKNRNS